MLPKPNISKYSSDVDHAVKFSSKKRRAISKCMTDIIRLYALYAHHSKKY